MARALWSGSISFGLVNIPVKLVTAVRDRDLHFHMLHADDGARIQFKRYCPADEREVDNAEIVKGYELSHGEYVTFTPKELEAADPEAARTIDISEFVPAASIDPAYYEKPYYLIPDKAAHKPYHLLLKALEKTGRVGIAKVVMRDKEYLVALRPRGDALLMSTMHFADEVVPPESLKEELAATGKEPDKRELALAERLIESLEAKFDPDRHTNTHRSKLLKLVEKKAAGHRITVEPAPKAAPRTVDIMAALERSLAEAGSAKRATRADDEDAEPEADAAPAKRPTRKREGRPKREKAKPKARKAA